MRRLEEPDSGYAWVIVFSACLINLILSGMARMIGILYVAIIESYAVSRQEASVPFTVRNAVRYLTGPLVGVLGQRFGIRAVTFYGGFTAAVGSILCCFAPTVTWITVFWGGIHGLGFSMGNTLFQVLVNQYFEKYRATASGIVLSGACIGSFILPMVLDSILNQYGVFGCFLILGGLFLNVMPPSLVLKAPLWVENPEEYEKQRMLLKGIPKSDSLAKSAHFQGKSDDGIKQKMVRSLSDCSMSDFDLFTFTQMSSQKPRLAVGSKKIIMNKTDEIPADNSNVVCTSYHTTDHSITKCSSLKMYKNAAETSKNAKSSIYFIERDSLAGDKIPKAPPKAESSILEIVKNIALLYKNPMYILISVNVATYFWLYIPMLTVVLDYSRDKGIHEENGKYLIHALTVGDLSGRLCFGWVTDRGVLSFSIYMALTFFAQGLFVFLFPFAKSLGLYMACLILYGVASGIIFVYFPVLVHKYVDQENQPIGVGCVGLVSGMLTFGIPPVIGYFRDHIGSYDGFFYILGCVSAVTGFLWLMEPLIMRKCPNAKVTTC